MEPLLQAEGTITPHCSKSHITYIFYLPKQSSKINIQFNYEPKCLEDRQTAKEIIGKELRNFILDEECSDYAENWEIFLPLNNLITLSVDDASGFRGCVHRHDHTQQLILSEHEASPGLMPGLIPAGLVRITLSIHAIVTSACHYDLKVWEGDEGLEKMDAL